MEQRKGDEDLSGFLRENSRMAREYVELRLELLRLQAVRIVSRAYSHLMVFLIVLLLMIFILFFLGMALAAWVSVLTGSPVLGYLSAAALFLLALLAAIRFRRPLFQDRMVRALLDTRDEAAADPEDPI